MKKLSTLLVLITMVILFQSAVKRGTNSGIPPSGYTGASGDFCVSCHSDFGLNSGGGSVTATGLPPFTYVPNQVYNFSINISHGNSDRQKWGFAVKAVNRNTGVAVGTFSTTNANSIVNSNELSHFLAVGTPSQSSYTYGNLKWTAPATANVPINFYYVGNAANSDGNNSGDYIYSGSIVMTLPIILKDFKATVYGSNVVLNWQTLTENNSDYFDIEKSDNGQTFYAVGRIAAAGNTSNAKAYSFTDNKPSYFEKPVFYRLKLVDKDNSYKYSDVVNVKLKAAGFQVIKAYPTLIKTGSTIFVEVVSEKSQNVTIQVIDITGKELERTTRLVTTGNNKLSFTPASTLSAGWLFARFITEASQQTISLSVQQ